MAMWHLLIGGINGMPLGFPAAFQFPWVFGFLKNFSFPSFRFFPFVLFLLSPRSPSGASAFVPATNFSGDISFFAFDRSFFQGTLFLRSPGLFSSQALYKFLIFLLSFAVFGFGRFRIGFLFHG